MKDIKPFSTTFAARAITTSVNMTLNGTQYQVLSRDGLDEVWTLSAAESALNLLTPSGAVHTTFPVEAAPTHISLAFDASMNTTIAWQIGNTTRYRYYNSLTSQYQVKEVVGTSSCLVVVDDYRANYTDDSDVLVFFTSGVTNTGVYFTRQRDRFETLYEAGSVEGARTLNRIGMTNEHRLQIELV